jgi:hypothetical protein
VISEGKEDIVMAAMRHINPGESYDDIWRAFVSARRGDGSSEIELWRIHTRWKSLGKATARSGYWKGKRRSR